MLRPFGILAAACVFSLGIYALDRGSVEAVDVQTLVSITVCRDGLVTPPEVCDEGPGGNIGSYASTTALRTCSPGCQSFFPYCGDSILQVRFGEECDDGNHTNSDLCDLSCRSETPAPPGGSGSPTVGSIPQQPAPPGNILSQTETRVVLRGKAYPNSLVNILVDGQITGTTRADANANFIYSTADVTPGTATFGFSSKDRDGIDSLTTSVVFEVVQSAITTVANVFFPPTIKTNVRQVPVGEPLLLSGQTIPNAKVSTLILPGSKLTLDAIADAAGIWALQVDTRSIEEGAHSAKSFFEQSSAVRSGYGRSVSFTVGDTPTVSDKSPDLNGDGKVNLVDFSIFLISWNTDDDRPDFNSDRIVNLADFSIMLFSWTG